jgi:ribosomal protein L37AE/L43A
MVQLQLDEAVEKNKSYYEYFTEAHKVRFAQCYVNALEFKCSACGLVSQYPIRCDLWYCEKCGARRSRKYFAKYINLLESYSNDYKLLTLTFKSFDIEVKSFRNILKRKREQIRRFLKKFYRGGMYSLEFGESGNFHAHILVLGSYVDQKRLSKEWLRITKDSDIVDVRKVWSMATSLDYVSKYCSKSTRLTNPDLIDKLTFCLRKSRRLAFFGELYNKVKSLKTIDFKRTCSCGNKEFIFTGYNVYNTSLVNVGNKLCVSQEQVSIKVGDGVDENG